jgi:[ribosomal protein S18]-alanine N-acetyltransferase
MSVDPFPAGGLFVPKLGRTLSFRRMQAGDLPAVVALEQMLFRSPWTEEMFREDLDQEYASMLVVFDEAVLAAFVVTYLVVDEMHIADVAVAPEFQRHGIAHAMLASLLKAGRERGYQLAHLEVRTSNHGAIALYEQLGFEKVGLRKNYYEIEKEDAVLMSCLIQVNPLLAP